MELRGGNNEGFHIITEAKYTHPYLKPAVVARTTDTIISHYFGGTLPDFDAASHYLSTDTLGFIDSVRMGLAQHPERVDRMLMASPDDLERALSFDRKSDLPPDEIAEVLDFTLVTMAAMPEVGAVNYTDHDGNQQSLTFNRKFLNPPRTLDEARIRIRELWAQIFRISNGDAPRNFGPFEHPEIQRSSAFWAKAKSLPLKNIQPKDALIELAKKFENPQDR